MKSPAHNQRRYLLLGLTKPKWDILNWGGWNKLDGTWQPFLKLAFSKCSCSRYFGRFIGASLRSGLYLVSCNVSPVLMVTFGSLVRSTACWNRVWRWVWPFNSLCRCIFFHDKGFLESLLSRKLPLDHGSWNREWLRTLSHLSVSIFTVNWEHRLFNVLVQFCSLAETSLSPKICVSHLWMGHSEHCPCCSTIQISGTTVALHV